MTEGRIDDSRPRGGRRRIRATALTIAMLAVWSVGIAPAQAQDEAQPITEATQELAAGRWVDASSGPTIAFSVDAGWYVDGLPLEGVGVPLAHTAFDGAYLTITRFDGGVFPEPCATQDNAAGFFESTGPEIDATVDGFAGHLDAHPYVDVTATTPAEVGGWSGVALDLRSVVDAVCDPPWAWLWRLPEVGDFHLADAEDARFIALDVDGTVTVIAMEAFTGPDIEAPFVDWPGFLDVATALVESMEITPAPR